MFCGLCVIACPTHAIEHTKLFEMNKHHLEDLVMEFVKDEDKRTAISRADELEKEAAAKKAAKAAAEKKKMEEEKND
jgi:formate hydrogenlyase subunit 6/NADH:ubiquinone oxidoreductase subunit I